MSIIKARLTLTFQWIKKLSMTIWHLRQTHSYKGEITDKSIARVSHSTSATDEILSGFDKCTQIRKPSGKHTEVSTEGDISALVEQFLEADLYRKIPGRKHSAFPEMKHSLLTDLNVDELKSWISNSLKKFSRKHFYKY